MINLTKNKNMKDEQLKELSKIIYLQVPNSVKIKELEEFIDENYMFLTPLMKRLLKVSTESENMVYELERQ